jgi:SMI1-KNR4 cell-wall
LSDDDVDSSSAKCLAVSEVVCSVLIAPRESFLLRRPQENQILSDSFDRLLALAPPPSSPVNAGSPDRWADIEEALGTSLPDDYKWLINTYGSGEFCDLLWILNPFSTVVGMNLLRQVDTLLEQYRKGRDEYYPEQCPFPIFPEPGGLLPAGGDSNGGNLFWVTSSEPKEWSLVLYDWRGGYDSEQHPMPLVDFLVGWLSGEISGCFFGVGINSPTIKEDPVFCPSGMIRESQKLGRDGKPPFGSAEGYWFAHIFHARALRCGLCGATRDCSTDLDLATITDEEPDRLMTLVRERTHRAIERAKQEGWQLVGYPFDPKFVCPACNRVSGGSKAIRSDP